MEEIGPTDHEKTVTAVMGTNVSSILYLNFFQLKIDKLSVKLFF